MRKLRRRSKQGRYEASLLRGMLDQNMERERRRISGMDSPPQHRIGGIVVQRKHLGAETEFMGQVSVASAVKGNEDAGKADE